MVDRLFQDELSYLRDVGRELAQQNPKLAPYLSEQGTDPQVERLLQGFAFLTARLRGQIDDHMSDFTQSLLSLLWPNFLRPFPATTMMKFFPLERSITDGQTIAAGSAILSRPVDKSQCLFKTTADCTVYPLELGKVELERLPHTSRLYLSFSTLSNMPLAQIGLKNLRLTFTGEEATNQMLYLWVGHHLKRARIRFTDGTSQPLDCTRQIIPIGFGIDEAILPQHSTEFEGYRLLQEYFVFPDKFYGYDLEQLAPLFCEQAGLDFTVEFDFSQPFPLEFRVDENAIKLYCVPAVNLSNHLSEVIFPRTERIFHPLKPGGLQSDDLEIFSVDGLTRAKSEEGRAGHGRRRYLAYEDFTRQTSEEAQTGQIYYRLRRKRALQSKHFSHDVFFVSDTNQLTMAEEGSLIADLTCFNRTGTKNLHIGDIDVATDTLPSFVRYHNISVPTAPLYPPLDGQFNWRLISNLALNYTALLHRDAVAAIISAYDYGAFSDRQAERATKRRIDAIESFNTQPIDRLFSGRPIRGVKSCMVVDENAFETQGELYLFTRVLSEFFTMSATINSFHEFEIRGKNTQTCYQWPPKTGRQPLI